MERPSFSFATLSSRQGPHYGIPTIEEFRETWKAWDLVTLGMMPSHLLHVKPIDLRHKCLFYLGHIPTSARLAFVHARVALCDTSPPLSAGSTIYFSAKSFNSPTSSHGNSPPYSRSVSRLIRRCCSHTASQRGIDPHVGDPNHCHVSACSLVITYIAQSVLEPL